MLPSSPGPTPAKRHALLTGPPARSKGQKVTKTSAELTVALSGGKGSAQTGATHLIKVAIDAVLGFLAQQRRPPFARGNGPLPVAPPTVSAPPRPRCRPPIGKSPNSVGRKPRNLPPEERAAVVDNCVKDKMNVQITQQMLRSRWPGMNGEHRLDKGML